MIKKKHVKKIEKHYDELSTRLTQNELEEIKNKIKLYEEEGTDYDVLYFKFKEVPNFSLQVTSLIDYQGKRAGSYKGNCQWADVGMFWLDYNDCEFDDLDDKENSFLIEREKEEKIIDELSECFLHLLLD